MNSTSLTLHYIGRVNRDMPRILATLRALDAHLRFLGSVADRKGIEPRELLRCAHEAREAAFDLKHSLAQIAEFRASVSRRSLGEVYGLFAGAYKGLSRQIADEFDAVERDASQLQQRALARLNEPGRWGDAAAPGVVAELAGLLNQILEMWSLLRVKPKLKA